MRGRESRQSRRWLLRLLAGDPQPNMRRFIPPPDDELLQLAESLLAELSRPLTAEERSHGWNVQKQRQMRRWVKSTRDMYRKGRVPAHLSGPIDFALPMSGGNRLDLISCHLIEFDYLLDQKIMATTGEGLDQVRDDLEELAELSRDSETAAEIRTVVRDYDEARARHQQRTHP